MALPGLLRGQASAPVLLWPNPAAIQFPAPLTSVQLNAIALAGEPVTVPLAGLYNVEGITTSGFPVGDGFDGGGQTYPAELLGSTILWRGVKFPLGAANAPDAVSSATIPLPAGSFGGLLMLGSLVNDQLPPTATFQVNYTDGSSATMNQSMSDWVFPLNYSGESVVQCVPYRYVLGRSIELDPVCVYGYAMALDPAKTVQSLVLPNDRNIVMLAFALVPAEVAGTVSYDPPAGTVLPSGRYELKATFTPASGATGANAAVAIRVDAPAVPLAPAIAWPVPQPIVYGTPLSSVQLDATASVAVAPTSVSLGSEVRTQAIEQDGVAFSLGGFDGAGDAYSFEQLGSALSFAGGTFPLGENQAIQSTTAALFSPVSGVPDVATSSTIPLPPGNFDTVYVMGAANGAQMAQTFTVNYTDGSSSASTQSVSDWRTPQNFAGETVVAATSEAVTESGALLAGTYDVYGYRFPIATAKTAASLTLPQNLNVMVLAVGVGTSHLAATEPGTFTYSPVAGTILQPGVQTLQVAYAPNDSTDIASGSDSVNLTVQKAPVTLSVSSTATAIEQGQSVTLSATVVSTTIGVPTGTVTFLSNGSPLATVGLTTQGTASFTTANLAPGVDAISVTYSGDVDFLSASIGGPTVNVMALDFAFESKSGTTLTVPWGGQGTILLHASPLGLRYESNLTLTVAGLDGLYSTASLSPEIVGALAGPSDVTLTVRQVSLSRLALPWSSRDGRLVAGLGVLLLLPVAASRRLRKRLGSALLVAIAAGLVMVPGLSGCGSGYQTASVPFTVSATDGTHTHTLTLTLTMVPPQ